MGKSTIIFFLLSFLFVAIPVIQTVLWQDTPNKCVAMENGNNTDELEGEYDDVDSEDSQLEYIRNSSQHFKTKSSGFPTFRMVDRLRLFEIIPPPPQS
jgi:hypothetical protein